LALKVEACREVKVATLDVPDDLWEFLQEHARRKRKKVGDVLAKVLEDYRTPETTNRSKTLAPKGYGPRPEERKQRSR
jgi:hypothetical protein